MPYAKKGYGRMNDGTCKSGKRYTFAPGIVGGGKSKYRCIPGHRKRKKPYKPCKPWQTRSVFGGRCRGRAPRGIAIVNP